MGNAKFSLNAFLLVVLLITGIAFFFTVHMVDMASLRVVNEYHPIEGTRAAVVYRSLEPSGIYEGDPVTGVLKLEGEFGFDWGMVRTGNTLYTNEYSRTSMGLVLCRVVRIDLSSYEKEVLLEDCVLRGRCASGELVCLGGAMLSSNLPRVNSLCRLYALAQPEIDGSGESAEVIYLDPASGAVLYRTADRQYAEGFEERYLQTAREEVRG